MEPDADAVVARSIADKLVNSLDEDLRGLGDEIGANAQAVDALISIQQIRLLRAMVAIGNKTKRAVKAGPTAPSTGGILGGLTVMRSITKARALELLGGSLQSAAEAVGVTAQAIDSWPAVLSPRITDRVLAALARKHLPAEVLGLIPTQETEGGAG